MPQIIPTSITLSEYTQATSLDGRSYVFRFLHNPRLDRWSFDLLDQDEDPIATGRRVVCEYDLLQGVADERKPQGVIMARDLTAPDFSPKILSQDPGLRDLGDRVKLTYFTEAEVAAFVADQ